MNINQIYKNYSFLSQFIDIAIIFFSWTISYYIKMVLNYPNANTLSTLIFQFSLIYVFLFYYFTQKQNIYYNIEEQTKPKQIFNIWGANTLAWISLVIFFYFTKEIKVSRILLMTYYFTSIFLLAFARLVIYPTLRKFEPKNKAKVLLVGNGSQILKYIEKVKTKKNISIIGWLDSRETAKDSSIPLLKGDLKKIKLELDPNSIIISYRGSDHDKLEETLRENYNDIIPIEVLPNLPNLLIGTKLENFQDIPILMFNEPSFTKIDIITKRILDIIGSIIGIIFLTPLFIAISILIKTTSRGSVFYRQKRIGLNRKPFNMWKFRSMTSAKNSEEEYEWSNPNNPRKTKLGKILRKTSLDELPQLWNVLKGEMSLVGPRPETPYFVEKFHQEIPAYMLRHKIKVGITGWAQVNGWRSDTSLNKRIEYDLYYIRNWSIWFDLKILLMTTWKCFKNAN